MNAKQIVADATVRARITGNHVKWELDQVMSTIDEPGLVVLAQSLDNRRLMRRVEKLSAKSGSDYNSWLHETRNMAANIITNTLLKT